MAAINLTAYELIPGSKVFVKVPDERGRWILTDWCVVKVACEACGSQIGEPCTGSHDFGIGYRVSTHWKRRLACRQEFGRAPTNPIKPRVTPEDLHTPADEPDTRAMLEVLIDLHLSATLSEGQLAKATGIYDRVELRRVVDEYRERTGKDYAA